MLDIVIQPDPNLVDHRLDEAITVRLLFADLVASDLALKQTPGSVVPDIAHLTPSQEYLLSGADMMGGSSRRAKEREVAAEMQHVSCCCFCFFFSFLII